MHTTKHLFLRFTGSVVASVLLILTANCPAQSNATNPDGPITAQRTGDGDRATIPFEALQPPVEPPAKSDSPPALSDRAKKSMDRADQLRAERRYTEAAIEMERALRIDADHPAVLRMLALTLWEAGDSARARVYVDKVLDERNDDIVCHYLAARLAAAQFENTQAVQHFRTALLCDASDELRRFVPLSQYHLAELLAAEGYVTAANELYTRLEAGLDGFDLTDAENQELASIAGVVNERIAAGYEALGQWDHAAKRLEQSTGERNGGADEKLRLARALTKAGDYEQAATIAREMLAVEPAAAGMLAEIYEKTGTPKRIIEDLRDAKSKSGGRANLVMALADALVRFDQADDAIAELAGHLKQFPDDSGVRWALFDRYVASKRFDDAVKVAADLIRNRPAWSRQALYKVLAVADQIPINPPNDAATDYAVGYLYGEIARAQGVDDRAQALFENAVRAKPDFVASRAALAEILLDQEKWQQVIDVAQPTGVRLEPSEAIEYCLGVASAGLDENEQAEAHLKAAIRLDRTKTRSMLALAELYSNTGNTDAHLNQLLEIVKIEPNHLEARELLFKSYLIDQSNRAMAAEQLNRIRQSGDAPNRVARCTAWLLHDPSKPDWAAFRKTLEETVAPADPDAETLTLIAWSYLGEDNNGAAKDALLAALALDPRSGPAQELLVQAYRSDLAFEEAIVAQRKLLDRFPNRQTFQQNLLSLLLIDQDYDQSIALATVLSESAGEGARANNYRLILIQANLISGHLDEGIKLLEAWQDEAPNNRAILTWLIQALFDSGRADEAMASIRQRSANDPSGMLWADTSVLVRIPAEHQSEVEQLILDGVLKNSDFPLAQYMLIDFLTTVGRYDEAIALAGNNRSKHVGSENFDNFLVRALSRAGRYKEAIELINSMVASSNPQNNSLMANDFYLIDLLIRAGEFEKAAEQLNRRIADTTDDDEKQAYLRALANCHQQNGRNADAIEALKLAKRIASDDVTLNNDLGYTLTESERELPEAEAMIRKAVAAIPSSAAYLDSLGWVRYKRGDVAEAKKWLTRARFAFDFDNEAGDILGEDPVICDHLGDACWRLGERAEAEKWWRQSIRFANRRLRISDQLVDRKALESVTEKLKAIESGGEPKVADIPEGSS